MANPSFRSVEVAVLAGWPTTKGMENDELPPPRYPRDRASNTPTTINKINKMARMMAYVFVRLRRGSSSRNSPV